MTGTGIGEVKAAQTGWKWFKSGLAFWKRIATLEERVSALEIAAKERKPDGCPACGAIAMRRESTSGVMGSDGKQYRLEGWKCGKCGQWEERSIKF